MFKMYWMKLSKRSSIIFKKQKNILVSRYKPPNTNVSHELKEENIHKFLYISLFLLQQRLSNKRK